MGLPAWLKNATDKQCSGHVKTQAVPLHQKEQCCQTSLLVWTDSVYTLAMNWWWLSSNVVSVHLYKWINLPRLEGHVVHWRCFPWTTENKLVWRAQSAQAISLFFPVLPSEFPDRLLNVYRWKAILRALLWQGFLEESNFGNPEKWLDSELQKQLLKSDIPLLQ